MLRRVHRITARCVHSSPSAAPYFKYADKLNKRALEKGLDLEQLKSRAREEARRQQKEEAATFLASFKSAHTNTRSDSPESTGLSNIRKDSSPVKPLSSILNLPKLLATPHTASQISALWTTYHASRNKGTGRGYICASLSLESYNTMMRVAKKYPVFVIPVPRQSDQDQSADGSTGQAHEFFFLQWDFHLAPPIPAAIETDPFDTVTLDSASHLPEPSTVLFTPLQEYKLRTSFATPYLVLTFYTDISQSHGIVLLRGEITPSSSTAGVQPEKDAPERFLLDQVDAQLLAMGLQKFYLWGKGRKDDDQNPTAEALLKQFHQEPKKFSWQHLLEFSGIMA